MAEERARNTESDALWRTENPGLIERIVSDCRLLATFLYLTRALVKMRREFVPPELAQVGMAPCRISVDDI